MYKGGGYGVHFGRGREYVRRGLEVNPVPHERARVEIIPEQGLGGNPVPDVRARLEIIPEQIEKQPVVEQNADQVWDGVDHGEEGEGSDIEDRSTGDVDSSQEEEEVQLVGNEGDPIEEDLQLRELQIIQPNGLQPEVTGEGVEEVPIDQQEGRLQERVPHVGAGNEGVDNEGAAHDEGRVGDEAAEVNNGAPPHPGAHGAYLIPIIGTRMIEHDGPMGSRQEGLEGYRHLVGPVTRSMTALTYRETPTLESVEAETVHRVEDSQPE